MTAKVLLQFSKRGEMRFVSNLDLQRVFEQALRRASIPLRFSEGYHPRPRMSLGPALPLGIESECERFTIRLEQPLARDELVERLNTNLPEGLEVRGATSDWVVSGEDLALETYEIRLQGEADVFERAVRRLGERPLNLVRETPKGKQLEVALHRDLERVSNDGKRLIVTFRSGPGHSRIRDVLAAIEHPLDATPPPRVRKLAVQPVPSEPDEVLSAEASRVPEKST